jgi:hypothetical protein
MAFCIAETLVEPGEVHEGLGLVAHGHRGGLYRVDDLVGGLLVAPHGRDAEHAQLGGAVGLLVGAKVGDDLLEVVHGGDEEAFALLLHGHGGRRGLAGAGVLVHEERQALRVGGYLQVGLAAPDGGLAPDGLVLGFVGYGREGGHGAVGAPGLQEALGLDHLEEPAVGRQGADVLGGFDHLEALA